jgi:transcription elongation factor GreB
MSRWRPPAAKPSPYITPQGRLKLEREFKALWERRPRVTAALAAAAAEGDRSENAEYIYRKKELREIDKRIAYLQKRIPELKVVTEVSDTNRIFFGARVSLEDTSAQEVTYRIVGPDEFDNAAEYISVDSPLGRALLNKTVDDEVALKTATGETTYTVIDIEYPDNS